jgi:hypothetical protein
MRSLILRPTGKFDANGVEVKEPVFLKNTGGKSLFRDGVRENGLDVRYNAAGDSALAASGYQIALDTLTYIIKQVTQQKFYEVAPADFVPVSVGEGAFAANIMTNRSYVNSGAFEDGNIRQGANNTKLASATVSVDSVTVPVKDWAMSVEYSVFDVEQALFANNWDLIEQKHRARKKVWDLGIQEIAFLGSKSDSGVKGLLNNASATVNTGRITKSIGSMTAAELQTLVTNLIADYFSNTTNSTALPTHLVVPMADWLGWGQLVQGTVGTYPVPLGDYLLQAFRRVCGPKFQILPVAYADATNNNSLRALNKNVYALYRYDAESLRMNIPVDYTVTQPGTQNNFQFQDVAYGQYTGLGLYRNLELLLFQY